MKAVSFARFTGYSPRILEIFVQVIFQMGRLAEKDGLPQGSVDTLGNLDGLVPHLSLLIGRPAEWPGYPEQILEELQRRFRASQGTVDIDRLAEKLYQLSSEESEKKHASDRLASRA